MMIGAISAQKKNLYLLDTKRDKPHRIATIFKLHYQLLTDTVEKSSKLLGVLNDSIIQLDSEAVNINNISFIRKATTGQKIKKGFGGIFFAIGSFTILYSLYHITSTKRSQGGESLRPNYGLTFLTGAFIGLPGYAMLEAPGKKYTLERRYKLIIK